MRSRVDHRPISVIKEVLDELEEIMFYKLVDLFWEF